MRTPIRTPLGELHGRDAIHLDRVVQRGGALHFQGEINGSLCEDLTKNDRWMGCEIEFHGVQAYECISVDACAWQPRSSFDEVAGSEWLAGLALEHPPQHFELRAYDFVYRIAADRFVVALGRERTD